MALSFEESKKQLSQQSSPMMASVPMTMSLEDDGIMLAAETWEKDNTGRYAWFYSYKDENISYIDDNKNIQVDNSQVNITQETNSQFIPFEMKRRYDNIDLANMAISIHFTTSDGEHGASKPVNVEYTKDKIRFVWLVDGNVTRIPGTIQFEIHADGSIFDSNGNKYTYRWKSKQTDKFNILKSLCGADTNCENAVNVDDSWVYDIVENVAKSVASEIAQLQVYEQVEAAERAASNAHASADAARDIADGLESSVSTQLDSALNNYYTKSDVDGLISDVNDVFVAVYDSTKYEDVKNAYDAGKAVFCINANTIYYLAKVVSEPDSTTSIYFSVIYGRVSAIISCNSSKGWSKENYAFETTDRKVTSISESSTNSQYPSAKAVYDAIKSIPIQDAFVVTYDESDYKTIVNAYKSGKIVVCKKDNEIYQLYNFTKDTVSQTDDNGETSTHAVHVANFYASNAQTLFAVKCDSDNNWSIAERSVETDSNKVTSLSEESDHTQYPSAKAVYDAIQAIPTPDVSGQIETHNTSEDAHQDIRDHVNTAIKYDEQELTDEQKLQARTNIDAADKNDVYTKSEIDLALSTLDLSDYYTKTEVDVKTNKLTVDTERVASDVSSLSSTVTKLQEDVGTIDRSPRLSYEATYDEEQIYTLWEISGEGESEVREPKGQFKITGGGGSSTSSILKIAYVTTSPVIATVNDRILITYNFTGTDSSGDIVPEAKYTWKIGTKIIASGTALYGDNVFDATDFATTSSQKFTLTITDDAGSLTTKSWNVQKVDVRLVSSFNDSDSYSGDVSFNYTPYGSIAKEIHFVLDGEEIGTVTTTASGIPASYTIPKQSHGSHLLEAYMTAVINGKTVGLEEIIDEESGEVIGYNHTIKVVKDIIWCEQDNKVPVIGCATREINVTQYNTVNIKYAVFDPNTETPEVVWYINDVAMPPEVLTKKDEYGYYTYTYKANEPGTFVFKITCGEAEPKEIVMEVEKLNINVAPVTANLAFDFNPVGYSNSAEDRLWKYNDITMDVSHNFDWVNGGYQIDENGDQYFCVKAGTHATINYNLFADDPKKTGKEFKVIFRTKNIRKRDTSFLKCINEENIGLDMKVENATVYESGGSSKTHYCEDAIIEYEFNINKDTDMMIVMSYEDGTPNTPYEYKSTSSFKQTSPEPIVIGSDDCDVHIYRIKAYSASLSDTDIKNNFIADSRNADEIINRYTRNNIYNDDGKLISTSTNGDFSVDALMKAAPDLRYVFLEVPQFTNDKDTKVYDCTTYFRYPAGTRPEDNWTCTGMMHRGQGTSSNLYGYAGRNIDLCMDEDTSLFTWVNENGETVESSTITLSDTSVPTDYLNIKVNIASSENANNAQMANRFNKYQPFLRYARKKDSNVKDTMEFYNCVVFIRETSTDPSVEHREFNDNDWHFYGIGNVGDSKKTDDTRVNNKKDPRECVVEIMDADKPLSAFPTGKEGHAICPVEEWGPGNTAYDSLYADLVYKTDEKTGEVKFKSFGNGSYEFRYEMKKITDEQRNVNIEAWRDLYKFIVTSTDEEFYANLKKYFVVDSALYFYLFTERYTMVDNRAKNSFWHYGKVYISTSEATALGETEASYYIIDDEQAAFADGYRWDLTFGYDFDTALGIDNTGDYVFSYGKEDTDYYVDGDPTSDYVFRVADSVFFCRLRDLFPKEMEAMFKDREEKNAWNSNSLIVQWDTAQAQFPEELWRLDYERKYYRTYLGLSIDNSISKGVDKTFLIGKFFGRKKYARRAFEINQEIYFATKYFGNKALEDVFWIRGNVPIGSSIKPNYSLTLVPYSDMYVCVKYTSTGLPIHKKVKAGQTCYFESDADRMDFIYVYAASFIQEVGDLSKCYVGDNNFSSATRLQKLVIGSTDKGYKNTFMKEVLVDNNPLLEYLDIRNVSGINTVIDVSSCNNLKELYAEGTSATGAIFATGGMLETAHLPNTINSLSLKNLNYIKDFVVDGGYGNLQTLIVEDTPSVNTYDIINNAPLLKLLRLVNMNWDSTYQIQDATIFDRLMTIGGIDSSGHEVETPLDSKFKGSVLTGNAHVAVMKEKLLDEYNNAWHDLDITYNTLITQYAVTFKNEDGTILEVQYVDKGNDATDPIVEGRIPTPTKESTVSTDYTYAGWDSSLEDIFSERTIIATYTGTTRTYTVKYVSRGTTLQESTGLYGEYVEYEHDIPTYTGEESGYKYYLFKDWDKSGYIDGDKTINAIFDEFEYNENSFAGRELKDLSEVEIYALTKLGIENTSIQVEDGDPYAFRIGYDVCYDDIDSKIIIENTTSFDGTNRLDTGIDLFREDRDFVLALDYEYFSGNTQNAVLAQCFKSNGSSGFKLWFNNSTNLKLQWGATVSSTSPSAQNAREMLVLRHKSGEDTIYIYKSNLSGMNIVTEEMKTPKNTIIDSTFVLGCSKEDDGEYTSNSIMNVYWCKVWYKDLGDSVCKKLANWTREDLSFEMCGQKRFYLTENPEKRSTMSFLLTHVLERSKRMNAAAINTGGWAEAELNKFLNSRLYNALPTQIKSLTKQVTVPSSIGNMSNEISTSECYITIPAAIELSAESTYNSPPYVNEMAISSGKTISYMTSNANRIRRNVVDGVATTYWTRSPSMYYSGRFVCVETGGSVYYYSYGYPTSTYGVVIEISF